MIFTLYMAYNGTLRATENFGNISLENSSRKPNHIQIISHSLIPYYLQNDIPFFRKAR